MNNPYQPSADIELADNSVSRGSHAILLCLAPWKLGEVARLCSDKECMLLGWIGLSIQFGLTLLCWGTSLGEPYRNIEEMFDLPIRGYFFCIAFGSVPAALLVSLTVASFGRASGRLILLTPWMLLVPYFFWLFCCFNSMLANPGFTIVNDHRPEWMKNEYIVWFGSPLCWAGVFLLTGASLVAYSRRFANTLQGTTESPATSDAPELSP